MTKKRLKPRFKRSSPPAAMRSAPDQELVREFSRRHQISLTQVLRLESAPIAVTSKAFGLINEGFASIDEKLYADPTIGLLLNMLHRSYEHVEASIVAFATGSGAAAEIVARAATEASINTLYILSGDRVSRLKAYFEHYFQDVDRQATAWEKAATNLQGAQAEAHRDGISIRRETNISTRKLFEGMFGPGTDTWPKTISMRFEAVGLGLDYRTVYARMSSETHGDAESTILYFLTMLQGDEKLREKMALEGVHFSRYLIRLAVSYFLRACGAYATAFDFDRSPAVIRELLAENEKTLVELADHIGAGI